MDKIIANIKHWQTTAIGILVAASAVLQSPGIQAFVSLSPKIANVASIAGTVVATGLLVLGAGPSGGAVNTAK